MGKKRISAGPDGLEAFHPVVAEWFRAQIGTPSLPQREAWPEIAAGKSVLVTAPTGAGKTLAAFLESINRLFVAGLSGALPEGVHVLYVSPLKALNNDISRNLDRPLAEIRAMCAARGIPFPDIRKAVRTGDTPDSERQRMLKSPPHILITTPESLFLMLTSVKAAAMLKNVRYLILDEIHALIGSKRGAHLSLSVERLAAAAAPGLVRIGLSATIQPLESAALFLGGLSPEGAVNPVVIIAPPLEKLKDLRIEMPVEDYRSLESGSVWPEIYDTVLRLVKSHTATIVFVNNRATAEKIAANVNDMAGEEICIPHHGSLSKERRFDIEGRFKTGGIRCMVATATLELGIDIGQVDLMIQIAAPISIAGGLQRLGRSGHRLDAVSRGRIIPKTRGDLLKSVFIAREMLAGRIEDTRLPREPLDILAQHIVSMACGGRWQEEALLGVIRRSASYKEVRETDLHRVLAMLAGDYEHKEDIPAKPRLSWDRINKVVEGTPYSRMLAISAGGTIPDRGMFPVVLSDGHTRIGELDEEYVFESRQGDIFMLGNAPWRMDLIDRNRVTVSPAASAQGAETPFWKGDGLGMPYTQGQRYGKWLREMEPRLKDGTLVPYLTETNLLDETGAVNVQQFLSDQCDAVGLLPHDRRIIVETLADGDAGVSVVLHAHFGGRVNATLEALLRQAVEETLRLSTFTTHTDDLILLYLYGVPDEVPSLFPLLSADLVERTLLRILPGTSRFSITFRHNAYRALIMGTRKHGARLPLWVQRLRSVEALDQAARSSDHPLMIETMRECMEDAFDVANTVQVLRDLAAGRIEVVPVTSWYPSPFASEVLFQFESTLLYASADPHPGGIRKPVVSGMDVLHLERRTEDRPLLDPALVRAAAGESRIVRKYLEADSDNAVHSLLLMHGDLTVAELDHAVQENVEFEKAALKNAVHEKAEPEDAGLGVMLPDTLNLLKSRLSSLSDAGRVKLLTSPVPHWIATEESELYQAATGEGTEGTWTTEEAGLRILRRFARYNSPFAEKDASNRYALPAGVLHRLLDKLEEEGFILRGSFSMPGTDEWCHRVVWERIRYRSLREAATAVKSRPASDYAAWLPELHRLGKTSAKPSEALLAVITQLTGLPLPAEWWEAVVFPARIPGYGGGLLDRLCASGRICWRVLPDTEGKGMQLAFYDREIMDVEGSPAEVREGLTLDEESVLQVLGERGACFTHVLTSATRQPVSQMMQSLSGLVSKGLVANDSFAPLRFFLEWQKARDTSAFVKRIALMTAKMEMGRWERVGPPPAQDSEKTLDMWFARYGMICREVAEVEGAPGWAESYERLKNREFAGKSARGLYFGGMSGIQFLPAGLPLPPSQEAGAWHVLVACDPALAYGRIVPHAESPLNFSRVHGTLVVLRNGIPVLTMERNGSGIRTMLSGDALTEAVRQAGKAFMEKRIWPTERHLSVSLSGAEGVTVDELRALLTACGYEAEVNRMVLRR